MPGLLRGAVGAGNLLALVAGADDERRPGDARDLHAVGRRDGPAGRRLLVARRERDGARGPGLGANEQRAPTGGGCRAHTRHLLHCWQRPVRAGQPARRLRPAAPDGPAPELPSGMSAPAREYHAGLARGIAVRSARIARPGEGERHLLAASDRQHVASVGRPGRRGHRGLAGRLGGLPPERAHRNDRQALVKPVRRERRGRRRALRRETSGVLPCHPPSGDRPLVGPLCVYGAALGGGRRESDRRRGT